MKKVIKYIIPAVVILIALTLYFEENKGISKKSVENDARKSQKIDDKWNVEKDANDKAAAMVFYNKDKTRSVFSIYINKGLFSGYEFVYGGGSYIVDKEILEYDIEGSNEKIYISMNKQKVNKVEFNNGKNIKMINENSPFVLILDDSESNAKFYNKNGVAIVENAKNNSMESLESEF